MHETKPQTAASRTTARVLGIILDALGSAPGSNVAIGLPSGSMLLPAAGLILGGTPCSVPLFRSAMERAALVTGCDVVVARHGMHPEVLEPVLWDVVIWSDSSTIPIHDLLLFAAMDGTSWLVPSGVGPHIRLAPDGLHLEAEPGFITWHERCAGVCEAAKRIVVATSGGCR